MGIDCKYFESYSLWNQNNTIVNYWSHLHTCTYSIFLVWQQYLCDWSNHYAPLNLVVINNPVAQITQCISLVSYNAPLCNRNVHLCAPFCYKIVHCGIWAWCIVGFTRWDCCDIGLSIPHEAAMTSSHGDSGHWWIPFTKGQSELWCFLCFFLNKLLKKQFSCRWFDTQWRFCLQVNSH